MRVNLDVFRRDAGGEGEAVTHIRHALGRHVDIVDASLGVVFHEAGFRLHRIARNALGIKGNLDYMRCLGERGVGRFRVAKFVFHREVALGFAVNDLGAWLECGFVVHDGR